MLNQTYSKNNKTGKCLKKHTPTILTRSSYLSMLILGMFLSGCGLFVPEEEEAAFLQLDEWQFENTNDQTAQITDAWVYVNGNSLGIYELPDILPVLPAGEQLLTIFPVIRENALRSTPVVYPFYDKYERTITFTPAQTTSVTPATQLTGNAKIEFFEDFEDGSHALGGQNNALKISKDPDKVRFGEAAGRLILSSEGEEVVITSTATFTELPTTVSAPVFLELSYRTDVELEVGIRGIDAAAGVDAFYYKVILCPIGDWNKVYINFQEELVASQLAGYQLAFRALAEDTGCGAIGGGPFEVLLDNIQLTRFRN